MQNDNPKLKIKKIKDLEKELEEVRIQLEKLKKQLEEVKKNEQEYKNKYLRALADYQNFEKRVGEEKEGWQIKIKKDLILKLLPILDNIDKAQIFVKDVGLRLVKDQFINFLKQEGVLEIDVLNKPFDPYLAEAVEVVEGKEDNLVIEVVRKGYYLGKSVIRPAQVKVSKKNIDQEAKEKAKNQLEKGDYM